jgi:hypothetical protein
MLRSPLARTTLLLTLLLVTVAGVAQSSAPTFTITTSNVSLSTTGTGSIPYTLTSVNGYIGKITVQCEAPTVPAGVSIPYCVVPTNAANCDPTLSNPPPANICTLTANQAFASSFSLIGNTAISPAGVSASQNPALAIFFVVALLSGLTLRRKAARRLTLPLFLAVLAGLSCTTGCGTAYHGFTPGTYTYVITATQTPVSLQLGANATVTIH